MRVDRASGVIVIFAILLLNNVYGSDEEDEDDPFKTTDPKKREPSPCEICKFFATELSSRLGESAQSKEVIETGHSLDRRKKFKYLTSELRLTEALHEPHVCEKILEYNVHAERKGSLRYAKGMSETMQTLHGLVNKGVKVELGIPYELWDKPSAEVSKMHRACFTFAEQHEDTIESWYYDHQHEGSLLNYLCADRYLKGKDQECLREVFKAKCDLGDEGGGSDTSTKKSKKIKSKQKEHFEEKRKPAVGNDEATEMLKDESIGKSVADNLKGDAGEVEADEVSEMPGHFTLAPAPDQWEIPKPTHAPTTTALPKTSRNEGDL